MTSNQPIVIYSSDSDEIPISCCKTSSTTTLIPEKNIELITISDTEDTSTTEKLNNDVAVQNSQKRKRRSDSQKYKKRKKHKKDLANVSAMTANNNNIFHFTNGRIPSTKQSHPSNKSATTEQKYERRSSRKKKRKKRQRNEVPMTEVPVPTPSEDMETTGDPRGPKKWTEEMRKFYFDIVPAAANLNLEDELAKKSDDNWQVGEIDRRRKISPYHDHNFTCKNCNRIGHLTQHCNELSNKDKHRMRNICWMCGTQGHQPDQCKLRICFRCGNPGITTFTDNCYICNSIDMYKVQCERCSMWGHISDNCTDNWRMYNSTVNPGEIIRGTAREKPTSQLCCCNCAKWGHVYEDCKKPKMNAYYDVSSSVVNYDYPMGKSQLAGYLRQAQGNSSRSSN